MAIELFVSYAHRDDELQAELSNHLALLRRQGIITEWHDRRIGAGQEWKAAIDERLDRAAVVLLLVSADFLASDYCVDLEMRRALERHSRGEARVIPVILRACDWASGPFAILQALPKDGKPVKSWPDRDEAWRDVALGIRAAAEGIAAGRRRRFHASATPDGLSERESGPPQEDAVSRRLTVKVHRAYFGGEPPAYCFITLTNISPRRPLEVTHVWYERGPYHIPVSPTARPLPVRLDLDQSWETWIAERDLPSDNVAQVGRHFRARISTGEVFESSIDVSVPPVGIVPGPPLGHAAQEPVESTGHAPTGRPVPMSTVAGIAMAQALASVSERALSAGETDLLYQVWLRSGKGWNQGAPASQLTEPFTSGTQAQREALVRKYAKSLRDRRPPYLVASYARSRDKGSKKAPVVVYRLAQERFAYWPRTAVFLLALVTGPLDDQGLIGVDAFRAYVEERFAFTEREFASCLDYTSLPPDATIVRPDPKYVYFHRYENAIRATSRVFEELHFLELVAAHHSLADRDISGEIRELLKRVQQLAP